MKTEVELDNKRAAELFTELLEKKGLTEAFKEAIKKDDWTSMEEYLNECEPYNYAECIPDCDLCRKIDSDWNYMCVENNNFMMY